MTSENKKEIEKLKNWTEEELSSAAGNRSKTLLELKERLEKLSAEEKKLRNLYLRRLSLGMSPIVTIKDCEYPEEILDKIKIGDELEEDILVDGQVEYKKGSIVTQEILEKVESLVEMPQYDYDKVDSVAFHEDGSIDYSKVNAPIQGPPTGFTSIDMPSLRNYSDKQIMEDAPLTSVYNYLYDNNKNHLGDIAFEYLGEKITYRKLFKNIIKTAKSFAKMGVKKGDIVTICSITTPQIIYSFYALNMLGAVSNIIDVRYPEKAIQEFLNEVKSKYCIILDLCYPNIKNVIDKTKVQKVITVSPVESQRRIVKALYNLKTKKEGKNVEIEYGDKYISWRDFIEAGKNENFDVASFKENTPAAIIHTGGTTGVPKGVELSNENINNVVVQIKNANVDTKRGFKFLNIMPPFIAYGLALGLVTPMVLGWKTRIVPNFEPDKFDELIAKYKPNGFMGVHTYFDSVMNSKKLKKADLSFIKIVLFGGMKVPSNYKKRINAFLRNHNCTAEVNEGYSCTENASAATKTVDGDDKLDSAGIPLVKTKVAAFNPGTNKEIAPGQEGELCIQSPTTMIGYYGHKEETDAVKMMHEDGYWNHTGDVGYTDAYGRVFVTDRIKRLFPRSGFKVYPSRIEDLFLSNQAVEKCAVVKMNDKIDGHAPWAVIVLKEEYKGKEDEIKKELLFKLHNSDLPPYFEPAKFIFTDELFYTDIGKVHYNSLEEFLSTSFSDGLPNTDMGQVSIKKLQKVLTTNK